MQIRINVVKKVKLPEIEYSNVYNYLKTNL